MALRRIKLGDLIELCSETNSSLEYSLEDVKGISIKKMFIETKADMQGVSLKPYLLVRPDSFAYVTVTSRNGEKITLAHNTSDKTYIVSSSYIVFKVKNPEVLNSDYLFMFFNRPEFDRYSRFDSWGSARETFSWEAMCDIEIELPDLPTQEKFVNVYLSMLENQKAYERGLDDLKLVCDGYIEDLRRNTQCTEINNYCWLKSDCRNKDLKCNNVRGVKVTKELAETKAEIDETSALNNYKLVEPWEIVYVPNTARMGDKFACALSEEFCCVSPIYEILQIDSNRLLPEYLFMWFRRTEFDRFARYNSWGSVREIIDWDTLGEFSIPIPNIEIQQSIVNIYKCYQERKSINERLKTQIKDICPILIKGSIEEAKEA